jgi:iron complex outermembrane receptor protein
MSLQELMGVMAFEGDMEVTAATKAGVQSHQAPSITTVIPRSVIRARGFRSIGEALATVPGLYVIDDHLTSNVAIRGIHGGPDSWSRVLKVMVDGQAVTEHATGGTLLGPEFLPMDAIEMIEVIRGPASALYGANAFLGVVNIVTRRPDPSGQIHGSGEVGLTGGQPTVAGQLFASAHVDGERTADIVLAVSAARLDRSGLSVPDSSPERADYLDEDGRPLRSEGDLSKPLSLFGRASWSTPDLGRLSLMALVQELDARGNFTIQSALRPQNRRALRNTVARLEYELPLLGERLTLRAFAAYAVSRSLPQEVLDVGEDTFTLRRDRHNRARQGGIEASWRFGHWGSLLAGVDHLGDRDRGDTIYMVVRDTGDQIQRTSGTRSSYANAGVYAQGIAHPVARLDVTAGLRYDINDVWDDALSGRLAAVYSLRDDLHLKLLWGSSFVPPAPVQLYGEPLRIDGERGNAQLRSQTAQTLEGSVSYRVGAQMSVQLNTFWTRVGDRVELVSAGSNLTAQNLTDSSTLGAEATAEFNRAPFYFRGNASWQHTTVARPHEAPAWWEVVYDPDAPGGRNPPAVPGWHAHATVGASFPAWFLDGSLTLHLAGERKASQANIRAAGVVYTLPAHALLDANLRLTELRLVPGRPTELSLHVTNLLDTRYAEAGQLGVDIPALHRSVFLRWTQGF